MYTGGAAGGVRKSGKSRIGGNSTPPGHRITLAAAAVPGPSGVDRWRSGDPPRQEVEAHLEGCAERAAGTERPRGSFPNMRSRSLRSPANNPDLIRGERGVSRALPGTELRRGDPVLTAELATELRHAVVARGERGLCDRLAGEDERAGTIQDALEASGVVAGS